MASSNLTAITLISEGAEATPATFNSRFEEIDENFQAINTSRIAQGSGSPEGVITANVSTLYNQTDGTYGKTLWVKRTGTGSTGWASIDTGSGMFNVDDYGAAADVDDTERIRRAAAAVFANGGGRLTGTPGKIYTVTPMRTVASLNGGNVGFYNYFDETTPYVEITDLELDASSTNAAWADSTLWVARNCSIAFRRCKFYSTRRGPFTVNPIAAAHWCLGYGGLYDVVFEDCDLSNLISWLFVQRNAILGGNGNLSKGIRIDRCTGDDVAYPFEGLGDGEDVTLDFTVTRPHRAIVLSSYDGSTDAPRNVRGTIRVTDPGAKATISGGCKDIDITYVEKGSTAASAEPKVVLTQQSGSAHASENIKLRFDIDYGSAALRGGAALVLHRTTNDSSADTNIRGHSIKGLIIEGAIRGTPAADEACINTTSGALFDPSDSHYGVKMAVLVQDSWIRWCGDANKDVMDWGKTTCPRGIVLHGISGNTLPPSFGRSNVALVTAANMDRDKDALGSAISLGGAAVPALRVWHSADTTTYLGPAQYGRTMTNESRATYIDYILPSATPGAEVMFVSTKAVNLDLDPRFATTLNGSHSSGGTQINCARDVVGISAGDSVILNGTHTYSVLTVTSARTFTVASLSTDFSTGMTVTRTHPIRGYVATTDRLRVPEAGNITLKCNVAQTWDIHRSRGVLYNVSQAANW